VQNCKDIRSTIKPYKVTLDSKFHFEVPGNELLKEVEDSAEHQCQLLMYANENTYMLGDTFLRHYYSIYDIDRYKVGLGKLIKIAPHRDEDSTGTTDDGTQDTDANGDGTGVTEDPTGDS
jgi:hypothetical protein